jgi:hypothetical protein
MRPPDHDESVFAATCGARVPAADITLYLRADLMSTFRSQSELHHLLHTAHPQRRVVAGMLVNALLDSVRPTSDRDQPTLRLRLWLLPGRLHVELRTRSPLRFDERSRVMFNRFAEHWEYNPRTVRVEVRTTLAQQSRARSAAP